MPWLSVAIVSALTATIQCRIVVACPAASCIVRRQLVVLPFAGSGPCPTVALGPNDRDHGVVGRPTDEDYDSAARPGVSALMPDQDSDSIMVQLAALHPRITTFPPRSCSSWPPSPSRSPGHGRASRSSTTGCVIAIFPNTTDRGGDDILLVTRTTANTHAASTGWGARGR
jgi:hypothetical protein